MIHAWPRLSLFLLCAGLAGTPAFAEPLPAPMPEPPKLPAPGGPVAIPYPDPDPQPPKCPLPICLPKPVATFQAAGAPPIEIQSLQWLAADQGVATSDPQEGGEIAGTVGAMSSGRTTSDPQEGGEVAGTVGARSTGRAAKRVPKAHVSEMTVSKVSDKASATLLRPVSSGRGKVKVTVLMNACVKGQHIPEGTVTMRGASYDLRGIDVLDCVHSDGNTDTCTLSYESVTG